MKPTKAERNQYIRVTLDSLYKRKITDVHLTLTQILVRGDKLKKRKRERKRSNGCKKLNLEYWMWELGAKKLLSLSIPIHYSKMVRSDILYLFSYLCIIHKIILWKLFISYPAVLHHTHIEQLKSQLIIPEMGYLYFYTQKILCTNNSTNCNKNKCYLLIISFNDDSY